MSSRRYASTELADDRQAIGPRQTHRGIVTDCAIDSVIRHARRCTARISRIVVDDDGPGSRIVDIPGLQCEAAGASFD